MVFFDFLAVDTKSEESLPDPVQYAWDLNDGLDFGLEKHFKDALVIMVEIWLRMEH